jgi:hypothetical protein
MHPLSSIPTSLLNIETYIFCNTNKKVMHVL